MGKFFHYFAYGSNMLPQRLIDRCPSTKAVCPAVAVDYRLEFWKAGQDGSGKAMLVASAGLRVPGVVFEINIDERAQLDRHEGSGYRRDDGFGVTATGTDGVLVASTYLALAVEQGLQPFDWYLATVIAGAMLYGMEESHLASLRETVFLQDPHTERLSRAVAIGAMRHHGVKDFRMLLNQRSGPHDPR